MTRQIPMSVCLSFVFIFVGSVSVAQEAKNPNSPKTAAPEAKNPNSPEARYKRALVFFEEGEYEKVQGLLSEILFPKPLLKDAKKIAKAHVLLAAVYLALGNEKAADRVVKVIVDIDVAFKFEAQYDPKLQKLAEKHRVERAKYLARVAAQPKTVEVLPMSTMDTVLHLVPFGLGQFSDGRYISGAVYLALQAGLGGYMAYLYRELEGQAGPLAEGKRQCNAELAACYATQWNMNMASGLFVASLVIGVVDSFVFRKPKPVTAMSPVAGVYIAPGADGASAHLGFAF